MAKNNPRIANRMADIEPFHVMDLLARARALESRGRDIVHMEIGEPIITAAKNAIDAGHTHYTPAVGLTALRESISHFYESEYGVAVSPDRIVITPGASGALLLTLGVLVNPGDEILLADPGYPCNRHFARLLEGKAIGVPVGSDTDYQLNAALLESNWGEKTIAGLLASPSNPTGTLISGDSLQSMSRVAESRSGHLVVDEIYHGLVYEGEAHTALSLSDDVFVINSFSKYFCMTGWRLGWLVAPEVYVREIDKLAQNIFLAAPTPSQYGALAAFTPETRAILDERREAFRERRDFLLPALRNLGFDIPVEPSGAFYIYANCSKFTDDSYAFAGQLLEQAGVAITPGRDFGNNAPDQHVRFAYTTSLDRLKEGIDRLAAFLG